MCSVGASIAVFSCGALAQEQESVDEITITGSKRAVGVDAQDYGAGLDLITGAELDARNITDFEALITQLPSVNLQTFGPGDSNYIIRGITSGAEESTVGVYFDEGPISGRFQQNGGGRQAGFTLVDLQAVEVYKGPQGTLFGANSLSGTVRFVTNKPNLSEFEGSAQTRLLTMAESDDLGYSANGVANFPIIEDVLGVRLVAWGEKTPGYIDNRLLGLDDVNDGETIGGRIHALFEPTSNISLLASVNYQEREVGNNSRQTPSGLFGPSQFATGAPGQFENFVFIGSDELQGPVAGGDYISTEGVRTNFDEDFLLATFTGNWTTDFGVFTGTYSRYDRSFLYIYDSTPTNVSPGLSGFFTGALGFAIPPTSVVVQPQERTIDSGEIRFASSFDGPFNFILGGFLAEEDSRFDLAVINSNAAGFAVEDFVPAAATPVTGAGGPGETNSVFGRFLENERSRRAVFGEVYFAPSETLEVTAGIRYFTFDVTDTQNNTGPDFLTGNEDQVFDNDEEEINYKFNVTYRPSDQLTTYIQAGSGFRPGATNISAGISALSASGGNVPAVFESDTLWNYEIGGKFESADGRFSLNSAFFYMDWDDVQIVQGNNFTFTTNGPSARVFGFEADGRAILTDYLELGAAFTYLDTRFTEDQEIVDGVTDTFLVFEGDELPKTPSFTANVNVTTPFNVDVAGGLDGFLRIDYSYKGDSNTVAQNRDVAGNVNPFFEEIPSYNVVDLNLSVGRDNWSAGLFVKNLTNELAVVDAFDSEQDPLFFVTLPPRIIGFNVSTSF